MSKWILMSSNFGAALSYQYLQKKHTSPFLTQPTYLIPSCNLQSPSTPDPDPSRRSKSIFSPHPVAQHVMWRPYHRKPACLKWQHFLVTLSRLGTDSSNSNNKFQFWLYLEHINYNLGHPLLNLKPKRRSMLSISWRQIGSSQDTTTNSHNTVLSTHYLLECHMPDHTCHQLTLADRSARNIRKGIKTAYKAKVDKLLPRHILDSTKEHTIAVR